MNAPFLKQAMKLVDINKYPYEIKQAVLNQAGLKFRLYQVHQIHTRLLAHLYSSSNGQPCLELSRLLHIAYAYLATQKKLYSHPVLAETLVEGLLRQTEARELYERMDELVELEDRARKERLRVAGYREDGQV